MLKVLPYLVLSILIAAVHALGQSEDASQLMDSWERHKEMADQSIFKGLPWRSVGPVDQGGRLVDIEVVPGEPYSFYVAYASGGIWKTVNNGLTFEPLYDDQPTIIIGDMAIDPSNKNVLWVGTGENNSSRSSYGGMGVFRSGDGGKTWESRGLVETDRIGRVLVHPENPDCVIVAALGPLYTVGGQRGIFRTFDSGKTWECVLQLDERTGFIDLAMDPTDPDVLYAASWDRLRRPWNLDEGGPGSAIWKTVDGGYTWNRCEGGFPSGEHVGRIGLSIAPSAPQTIYAMVDNHEILPEEEWEMGRDPVTAKKLRKMTVEEFLEQKPEDVEDFLKSNNFDPKLEGEEVQRQVKDGELTLEDLLRACQDANAELFETDIRGVELWRSDDGGASWKKTHDDSLRKLAHTYGYYFGQIRVAPDNAERLYLLGVPLLVSDDGGATFTGCNMDNVHSDQQAMWIDPDFPNRIIIGNDGGLNMTYDGGKRWLKLNSTCVGQFYTVSVDRAKPYNIYGGLQDNGVLKGPSTWREGSAPWKTVGWGDGMYVHVDPRDNKTIYWGSQFGWYSRTGPSGRGTVRPRNELKAPALRYNWCTPVMLSSFNADIVYFGTQYLHRSFDKGETWTKISQDLTRSEERGNVPFGTLTTISESELTFGLIWVGTDDGMVHVTDDGGREWKIVSGPFPAGLWVTRVEASRHEESTAYVSFSGYREDHVGAYIFRTDDLGETWTSIADGLPAEPVNVVREDPEKKEILYAGTDRGAYISLDRGESWNALSGGLPNVPVHDMVVHPEESDLVAGTHGRSVWVLDVKPIQDLDDEILAKAIHIFPVDKITERGSWEREPSQWFDKPERRPKKTVHFWSSAGGEGKLSIVDEKDRPLFEDSIEAARGLNTYDWDYQVEFDLALAVEQKWIEEKDEEEKEPEMGAFEKKKDEGWLPYIVPGEYKLRIEKDGNISDVKLDVNARK